MSVLKYKDPVTGEIKKVGYGNNEHNHDDRYYPKEDIDNMLENVALSSTPENLLHNWYFIDPVNQRGQKEYTCDSGSIYTIDRWVTSYGEKVTVLDGAVRITCTGTQGRTFYQKTEHNLDGRSVTVSVLAKSVEGNGATLLFQNQSGTTIGEELEITGAGLFTQTCIVPEGSGNVRVRIAPTDVDASVDLLAAKLEVGTEQTLAKQVDGEWVIIDPAPNKVEETVKCVLSRADSTDRYANGGIITLKGTEDLVAGESYLPDGVVYIVYE